MINGSENEKHKISSKNLVAVNLLFFISSLTSVFGKFAAEENEINLRFLLYYGGSLMVMGIYALCWQQIIKRMPLMVAYANKAVVVLWGLLWGCLFFGESVTIGKISGIVLVVAGVVLFAISEGVDAV